MDKEQYNFFAMLLLEGYGELEEGHAPFVALKKWLYKFHREQFDEFVKNWNEVKNLWKK